jgi:D-arabinose 1-dehydrogenase-like Zn-dependent alcohol dehydrogenase
MRAAVVTDFHSPLKVQEEGIGIVEQLGVGVTSRRVGERVSIAWLGYTCGECEFCLDGWETRTVKLPIFDTVLKGNSVIGSIVGTRKDLSEVFTLHAAGRTQVIAVDRKIDEVNQSVDDVLAGRIPARIVFGF